MLDGLVEQDSATFISNCGKDKSLCFAELYCASVSKQVFVYELSFENEFDMPGNLKSMSTRGPDRGDTCHLTDFSETWPD